MQHQDYISVQKFPNGYIQIMEFVPHVWKEAEQMKKHVFHVLVEYMPRDPYHAIDKEMADRWVRAILECSRVDGSPTKINLSPEARAVVTLLLQHPQMHEDRTEWIRLYHECVGVLGRSQQQHMCHRVAEECLASLDLNKAEPTVDSLQSLRRSEWHVGENLKDLKGQMEKLEVQRRHDLLRARLQRDRHNTLARLIAAYVPSDAAADLDAEGIQKVWEEKFQTEGPKLKWLKAKEENLPVDLTYTLDQVMAVLNKQSQTCPLLMLVGPSVKKNLETLATEK